MHNLFEVGANQESSMHAINRISDLILQNVDPDVSSAEILKFLKKSLKAFGAVSLGIDEENQHLYLKSYTQSKIVKMAMKFVPIDVFGLHYPLNSTALISKCVREDKVIVARNLKDFFYPDFKNAELLDSIQKILKLKACVGMPVKADGKVIGAFFVVTKNDKIDQSELMLLQFFANFSGIASLNYINFKKLQERYEAEREIAAILTHELKTPIAIAYNSAELLDMTLRKYEKAFPAEFIEKLKEKQLEIKESIMRMNRVCNSIFSLTEVENNVSSEHQKLNLTNALDELLVVYKRYEKKKVRFDYNKKIASGNFYGAGIQFTQVISIILENAFKYTNQGLVSLELIQDKKQMICKITDSGPGIADSEKGKVFDRFYRTKGSVHVSTFDKGLGLGLYIAKKITEKTGGEIILEDNPKGQGTCFTIIFPVFTSRAKKQSK